MGEWVREEWRWKLEWRRPWFEWERSLLTNFLQVLSNYVPKRNSQDIWVWNNNPTISFSVRDAYALIGQQQGHAEEESFKFLCQKTVPSKIGAFGWRLMYNRLQTKDNLLKRNILPQGGDANYILCNEALESCSHLFFSCKAAYCIWYSCYDWLGYQCVLPSEAINHFKQHMGLA